MLSKKTCTLDKIELENFLLKINYYKKEEKYNKHFYQKVLSLSQLLGDERQNYTVVTIKDKYKNNNGVVPSHTTYFTQKIIDNKTKEEVSLEDLSTKVTCKTIDFKKIIHRLKPIPKNVIDNIPFTHISRSPVHNFGLFTDKSIKKNEKIGKVYRELANKEHISQTKPLKTKCNYINHSRLPNVKLVDLYIVATDKIRKGEEILIDYRQDCLKGCLTDRDWLYL